MSNSESPFFNENEIFYHFEKVKFDLAHSDILTSWLKAAILSKNKKLGVINFIFCTDEYLHHLNLKYLNHDTYTDVITFPYSIDDIEADVFISVDRVKENAESLKVAFDTELHRVMIHSVLHLLGLNDKSEKDKKQMTKSEDDHLSILHEMLLNNS